MRCFNAVRTLSSMALVAGVAISAGGSLARAAVVADSFDDWSLTGTQGENGWFNGYYNKTGDADGVYTTGELTLFRNDGSNVPGAANDWDGNFYNLVPGDPPWTELSRDTLHPSGGPPNPHHWVIRRWVADVAVPQVQLKWHIRKTNTGCGNGVTGRLIVNGAEIDSRSIPGSDGTGITRSVLRAISVGDMIELALDPVGADGNPQDGCDGTVSRLTVDDSPPDTDGDSVPDAADNCPANSNAAQADGDTDGKGDVCDNCPANANDTQSDRDSDGKGDACDDSILADSFDDWSTTGVQGNKGWFGGYYNLTLDTAQPGYSDVDFTPFPRNPQFPNCDRTVNVWDGNQWNLDCGGGAPWTELGREALHPNGTNSAPNQEHWAIRRWVSTYAGDTFVTWHARKTNLNGGGVTAHLLVNGVELGVATIAGNDGTGVTRKTIVQLRVGDRVDLALDPTNTDGTRGDGADGSATRLSIDKFTAPPVPDVSTVGYVVLVSAFLGLGALLLGRRHRGAARASA